MGVEAELGRTVTSSADGIARGLVGDLHRASDQLNDAIREYRRVLSASSDLGAGERAEIRLRLCDCLIESREYVEARDAIAGLSDDAELPVGQRARAFARGGWCDLFLGHPGKCVQQCKVAVSLLLPTSHHDELAEALRWLGHGLRFVGQTRAACENFRDALAAARRGSDLAQQSFCLEALGQVTRLAGRFTEAVELHRESMRVNERRGARKFVGFDWFHIGFSQLYMGDWAAARRSLDQAARVFVELGDERAQIPVLIACSRLERRLGDPGIAREHADRALRLAMESNYRRAIVLANEELADLEMEAGNHRGATTILESALADAQSIAPEGDLVYEISWRLAVATLPEDAKRAESLAERALALAHAAGDRREAGSAAVALSRVLLKQGKRDEAVRLAEEGLREFESIETPFELAGAHEARAEVLWGDASREADVTAHLLEAKRLHSRLGSTREVERLDAVIVARAGVSRAGHRVVAGHGSPDPLTVLCFDPAMTALFSTARDLAPYETTVLIEGETGAGKEIVARLLHDAGPRAARPFVALNCAAFPAALLESELFGHRRGAFTGADRDYRGRLAAAEDGTVLLDEIDKASPEFQAKLLRVIEDRRVFPVGSTESIPLRARLVCATNRDLRARAEGGLFLRDLYFRLAAFRLWIPPLRERPDDIRGFVRHYLDACVGRFGSDTYDVSRDALTALLAYHWPGNVRELKNVMESAAFFARLGGVIELTHLPPEIVNAVGQPGNASLPERLEEMERSQIELALNKTGGNKSVAARMLGVSRKGLLDRIRRLGME